MCQLDLIHHPRIDVVGAELLVMGAIFIRCVFETVLACPGSVGVSKLRIDFTARICTCEIFVLGMHHDPVLDRLKVVHGWCVYVDGIGIYVVGCLIVLALGDIEADTEIIDTHVEEACTRLPALYDATAGSFKAIHRCSVANVRGRGNCRDIAVISLCRKTARGDRSRCLVDNDLCGIDVFEGKILTVLGALNAHVVGSCVYGKRSAPATVKHLTLVGDGKARHIESEAVRDRHGNRITVIGRGRACDRDVSGRNGALQLPTRVERDIACRIVYGAFRVAVTARLCIVPTEEDVVCSRCVRKRADGGAIGHGLRGTRGGSLSRIEGDRIIVHRPLCVKGKVCRGHLAAPVYRSLKVRIIIPAAKGMTRARGICGRKHCRSLLYGLRCHRIATVRFIGDRILFRRLFGKHDGYGIYDIALYTADHGRNRGNVRDIATHKGIDRGNKVIGGGHFTLLVDLCDRIKVDTDKLIGDLTRIADILCTVDVRAFHKDACIRTDDLVRRRDPIRGHTVFNAFIYTDTCKDGIFAVLLRTRFEKLGEVEFFAVSGTEDHFRFRSVGILNARDRDLVLAEIQIEVINGVEQDRLLMRLDLFAAVRSGIARIARILEVIFTRIARKGQNLLIGGQLEHFALEESLRPYGVVSLGFVTDLDGCVSVFDQLLICEVSPYERNGDLHIVLRPAQLIEHPYEAQIAGKVVHALGDVHLNLVIDKILLAVLFLIHGNKGEILTRHRVSEVRLVRMLGDGEVIAAPEIIIIVGDPRHYGGILRALDHIQSLHRAEFLGKLRKNAVGGVAVLITHDDLFAVLQLGCKAVDILSRTCREELPLARVKLPALFKK